MPFAWTAIWLQNIIKGKAEAHGDSDSDSTASNSLDRKSSAAAIEQLKRTTLPAGKDASSLSRKGSLDRKDKRQSWAGTAGGAAGSSGTLTSTQANSSAEDVRTQLDNFPPVTLTVSSFFKQEAEKLKDEDLYKFLLDLKRPSTALKKLKCIRGELKLDISVAQERIKHCFTPELTKIIPFPDTKTRPTKEIVEFPPREVFVPNYQFLIYST